jgi:23S rRNA G2445 N2-methylase RlmL
VRRLFHATAAAVMAYLTKPTTEDQVINLCCGSGTLAIERARLGGAARITAVDHDRAALNMAHENALAAGAEIAFQHGDAARTGHADGFFDALLADLPFGNKVGSHRTNAASYEPIMQEAARLVRTGGMAVIITHEITLLDGILAREADLWHVEKVIPVVQRGLHPRIYVLRRTQARTATSQA